MAEEEAWEEDEWELCNDDGFVYKRRKRKRRSGDVEEEGRSNGVSADLEADLLQRRKERKKQTLMKLKEKYQEEMVQWENLSNSMKEMEERAQQKNQKLQQEAPSCSSSVIPVTEKKVGNGYQPLIDELQLKAETLEAMVQDISNLCDAAKIIFEVEVELKKKCFIELPVWDSSPLNLMTSLCDQDYCNNNDNVENT